MKKKLLIIFILNQYSLLYGQKIEVVYDFSFNTNYENFQSQLTILNDTISIYEIFEENENENTKTVTDGLNSNIIIKEPVYKNRIIVKHHLLNSIEYYRPKFETPKEYIKITEPLKTIEWELTDESNIILNFKCFKAIGKFKEKYYSAWYCPELSFSDGPWKFNGLPGLILQIESEDDSLSIIAEKIKINSEIDKNSKIEFIFSKKYTWDEYINETKIQLKKIEKYAISSSEYNMSVSIKFEEPDFTIKFE